ncbi:MAG: hypothetical protein WBW88_09785 [Rhodothermales bacterium]|jgi:hypothetical protein
MSEFEVLIPLAFFLFAFIILSKMMKYRHERKKWELMKHDDGAEKSLTTSELQLMIDDAVAHATLELESRLERLERPQIEAHDESVPVEKTVGRSGKSI